MNISVYTVGMWDMLLTVKITDHSSIAPDATIVKVLHFNLYILRNWNINTIYLQCRKVPEKHFLYMYQQVLYNNFLSLGYAHLFFFSVTIYPPFCLLYLPFSHFSEPKVQRLNETDTKICIL